MRASLTCAIAVATCGLAAGCLDRDLKPLTPCTVSGVVQQVRVTTVDDVDLLFMIDNSGSMAQEQTSLAAQLPRMMRILATGDLDGDGVREFPPVKSLHVGVVSSDMGTGGYTVHTCADSDLGDDGVLRTGGNTSIAGCNASYPSFLEFEQGTGQDPEVLAQDFQCVAQLGTGGCGFEQQLEATLKALTPGTAPIQFHMGTTGHGDGENTGFLREGSLLAVVVLTDEEDCSLAVPELANPASTTYTGSLNLRCFRYPEAVHPVERYVQGLLALRDDPDLLVYATISGVPPELVSAGGEIDYEGILAHPLMREEIDPTNPEQLRPSCAVTDRGLAFPPRRLVRLAQQLDAAGANAVVQSICQADFGPALNDILKKIADVLGGACLPRDLIPDERGMVGCDVVEVLPATGIRCEDLPGRLPQGTDGEGRPVCRVTQISRNEIADTNGNGVIDPGEAPGAGWYYDDFTDDALDRCDLDGQRISYAPGSEPRTGTDVRLECLQSIQQLPGHGPGAITLGTPCAAGCEGAGLACEGASNTCQQGCGGTSDCTAVGLGGWVCSEGFCRNPICTSTSSTGA